MPSLVALKTAVPVVRARTIACAPNGNRLSTVLSLTNQATGRSVWTLPPESRSSALKPTLSPTPRLAPPGMTVTVATGAGAPTT